MNISVEDSMDLNLIRQAVKEEMGQLAIEARNRILLRNKRLFIFFAKRYIKHLRKLPQFKNQLTLDPVHSFRDAAQIVFLGAIYSINKYVEKFSNGKGPHFYSWIEYGIKKAIWDELISHSKVHIPAEDKRIGIKASIIAAKLAMRNSKPWEYQELESELGRNGLGDKEKQIASKVHNLIIDSLDDSTDHQGGDNGRNGSFVLAEMILDDKDVKNKKLIDLKLLIQIILSGKRLNVEQKEDLVIFYSWLWEDLGPEELIIKFGFKEKNARPARRAILRVIREMQKEDLDGLKKFLKNEISMAEALELLARSRRNGKRKYPYPLPKRVEIFGHQESRYSYLKQKSPQLTN